MAQAWTTKDIPDQTGRVAIVTGANSGLGLEVSHALAARGATVVLACRSVRNAEAARAAIIAAHPRADVQLGLLDVSSLASVRAFADDVRGRFPGIDLLVNNAGIMATPRARSVDGFEMQFATNHLGHYALAGLLVPAMGTRIGSRVVAVASIAARTGRIDFDDLMGERRYDEWKAYNQSKLANLMFAMEYARRLRRAGLATQALAAHPGASSTNLFSTPGGFIAKRILSPLAKAFFFQSAADGALPLLYAATAVEAQPGGYYGPANANEMKGPVAPAKVPAQANDAAVAAKLWQASERLTGVSYP